jgi:hypothetical protein
MKSFLAILTMLLLWPSFAFAQPGPTGAPPILKVVSKAEKEKGEVLLLTSVTKYVPVTVEKEVVVDGMKMKVTVTENVAVSEMVQEVIKISDGRVITPDGKQLPLDEVWKRLTKNTVVAVSLDGNTPGQAYLRALNPNTLIIIPGAPKNAPLPK